MNLFEALAHIEQRPAMFFNGPATLALLDAFVLGYMTRADAENVVGSNGLDFSYFNAWLEGVLPDTLPENHGWRRRIAKVADTEEAAVRLFFKLMQQFSEGKLSIRHENIEPILLEWSKGTAATALEDFEEIKETIVRFKYIQHEHSVTQFKIGYNANDFKVYVEPFIGDRSLHTERFTEEEK